MVMVDVILLRLDKVEDTSFETSHSSYAIEAFCYNGVFGSGGGGEVSVLLIDLAVNPDDSQNPEALKGQMEQFGQAMESET